LATCFLLSPSAFRALLAGAWSGFDTAVRTTFLTRLSGLSPSSYQAIEEELVVLVSEKARLTIVPALNDVHGKTGNFEARTTWHERSGISYSIPPTTRDTQNG
jgi:hypothetical protein